MAGAGAFMLVLTWRSLRRGGRWPWRAALLAMRALAVTVLLLVLLRPHRVIERRELIRQRLVVLADASLSMDLPSGMEDHSRRELLALRLGGAGGLIDRLRSDFDLRFVEFGDGVREAQPDLLSRPVHAAPAPSSIGGRTDLRGALDAVRLEHGGEALSGVLLLSDGMDTELPDDAARRRELLLPSVQRLRAPVFAFCPAAPEALLDAGITSLRYSAIAFVRQPWEVTVEIVVVGRAEGILTVLLRRGRNVVQMRRVQLEPGRSTYSVPFSFTPARAGETMLTVEVQPLPGETCVANNYAGLVLSVVRDRIRVLHVAGRPSWDVRFLRRTLKQMPTVDLVSFFILRDMLDDPGPPTRESYVNLIPFPTDELFTRELRTFDVVIFQNFSYELFQPYPGAFVPFLQNIHRHVRSDGAGFVMLGGDRSFDLAGYGMTPLAGILPTRLEGGAGEVDLTSFRAELTDLGTRHPITRIEPAEDRNAALWDAMPELHGCHVLPDLRPGAVVLLEHPGIERGGRRLPIVAIAEVGQGRSMAVATDEVWRWAFEAAGAGLGNRLYLRFWNNTLRWLVHELEDRRVTISLEERTVAPGERARGIVRALDSEYRPQAGAEIDVRVVRVADDSVVETFRVETDDRGQAAFRFPMDEVGAFRIEATPGPGWPTDGDVPGEDAGTAAVTSMQVETPGGEMRDLRADEELLRAAAEASGGSFRNLVREQPPAQLGVVGTPVERVIARRSEPFWRGSRAWGAYGVVVGLLCVEWWLRRRRGVT
jgi:hypothetical protein